MNTMNTINNNKNFNQLCQIDNNNTTDLSSYSEGMPFLNDDATYYHSQQQQQQQQQGVEDEDDIDIEEDGQQKSYQQGDDFRPTFYNPFEIKHRRRTSRAQFKVLEKTFLENPKPNAAIRRWLAQKLVMTPRGVQVWFQNRRAKEKTVNSKKSPSTSSAASTSPAVVSSSLSSESTLSLSPPPISTVMASEPLVKQLSNTSSYDNLFININNKQSPTMTSVLSSPIHSVCTCNDCHSTSANMFVATPMTRTMSYPPFYHSDASSTNADEEELLMTPVTPFVDATLQQQQQQCLYDYPIFMNNNRKFYNQQQQQDWTQWPTMTIDQQEDECNFYNQQQQSAMRRMYNDNMMFDDNRRYSHPVVNSTAVEDRFFQSTEVFRRLSEPIFDHHHQQQEMTFSYSQPQPVFDSHFDLLPRTTTNRYSM